MNPRAIWSFVAGDSRRTPVAVAIAIGLAIALVRWVPALGAWTGLIFAGTIAAGLVAGVFERPRN